ncbi:MAG: transcriptional regulator with XRE-family HTH domain [Phenylobacterium sp.]
MLTPNPLPIRLKQARTAAKISQKELGLRLGMDDNTASSRMNHYEKGRHTPDYQTLKRIADELGVPVSYFFCKSDQTAQLICLIERLGEGDKSQLIEKLGEMVKEEKS